MFYRKSWVSEFEGQMKTRTFSMVDRVPERRKSAGSKWHFDYNTDKERKITKFKAKMVAKRFT